MLDCLDNFIGYRPICTEGVNAPESGLYIDDMPMVSAELFEQLSSATQHDNPEAVWDKIYGRAADHFATDVRKYLKSVKDIRIISNQWTGQYEKTYEAFTGGANYNGVYVKVWGSPLMDVNFSRVQLYLDAAVTVTLVIFDGQDGTQLWTDQFSGAEGRNVFEINQTFATLDDRREFFIAYNGFGLTSYKTRNTSGATNNSSWKSGQIIIGLTPIEDNITFTSAAAENGLLLNYSVACNLNNFICQHKDQLAIALRLKVMLEILTEMRHSYFSTNSAGLIDKEDIDTLRDQWEQAYASEMSGVLDSILPVDDSVCLECKEPVKTTVTLP